MTGVAVEAAAVAMKAAEVATVEAETVGELTETLDATRVCCIWEEGLVAPVHGPYCRSPWESCCLYQQAAPPAPQTHNFSSPNGVAFRVGAL